MMRQISEDQKKILKEFIKFILPKRGNKRKGSSNELEYLSSTLNKVFIQNFGFNLSRQDILTAFEELEYEIFTRNGKWNSESKIYKPSTKGDSIRRGEGYDSYDAAFIYIDIEQPIVRQLMLSTMSPLPNTGDKKIQQYNLVKKRLELFREQINSLQPAGSSIIRS